MYIEIAFYCSIYASVLEIVFHRTTAAVYSFVELDRKMLIL